MIALKKFGVDIGPILASVGIIGVAVGFGAQELVRDFISGFFILLENQVRTGDVAVINGTGGLVEKIEMRTITLRDFSGTVHVFQNGKINTLSNMTREWSAMVFDIGVAYKENVDEVMDVMREVGEELQSDENFKKAFLEPIEIFGLDSFGDSAIVIKARIKTKPIQQWTVGREYRRRLKAAFDAKNIEIPFPHTTVYWGEEISPLKLDVNQSTATKN
jgi:small conductance mechanosensitive channel